MTAVVNKVHDKETANNTDHRKSLGTLRITNGGREGGEITSSVDNKVIGLIFRFESFEH